MIEINRAPVAIIHHNAIYALKCLHGCKDAIIGMFYFEEGCICFSDKIQALCLHHYKKIEQNYYDKPIVELIRLND